MTAIELLGMASMAFVVWFTWRAATGPQGGSGQTRRESIIEAWVNIVIGFSLNFCFNLVLLPLMTEGGHLTLANNWWGGWIFTVLSIVRQYAIRRWANAHIRGFVTWLAAALSRLSLFRA